MFATLKNLLSGKNESPQIEYWRGNIGLTLMVYNQQLEAHVQSTIRPYDYYFKVTPANGQEERLLGVIRDIYHQHRLHFQQAEPNDLNYIAVVESAFQRLSTEEINAKPWLNSQRPHWESSHCVVVTTNSFEKENPASF
jgi:hypothetical protein